MRYHVTIDASLVELVTGKANFEVDAEQAGILESSKGEGEDLDVGEAIGIIDMRFPPRFAA